ncbi:MAG: DNA primase [Lactimicrobium massiliense]|nr:DNA primase [Lactimicrobium massiliense]MDD6229999.1 DNA primase [Lactimicrobium massiliense]
MAYLSEDEINAVRAKADIVDVISHYLQVHKQGRMYKAVCPFHDDHDPSLNINPDMQIYKCFVCGAGGNVFSFVQRYEHVSFPEAVGKVADMIGFPLSSSPVKKKREVDPHRQRLYDALQETINYTMYELNSTDGAAARSYLKGRGMDDHTLERFQIGWNPEGDSLTRFLHAKHYEDQTLTAVNVSRITSQGLQDVFASRITFPIHDAYGNPVGFSARTMDPDNPAKYINTTQTEIYVKGQLVYNAHRAKEEARRAGRIYICEGVTDVIAFDRAGIANAVCTLGTACTQEQIRLIRHLAPLLVFCYDGDQAGQNATWRAVQMARKENCEVAVIDNRTGKDPDEILRQDGKEALQNLAAKEISWMDFYLSYMEKRTNLNSYLEKKEFITQASQIAETITDEMDRKYLLDQASRITGIQAVYTPRQEEISVPMPSSQLHVSHVAPAAGNDKAEEQILMMMLKYPGASRIFEDELGYLLNPQRQTLAVMILEMVHQQGKADPQVLMDRTQDQQIRDLISALVCSEAYEMDFDASMLSGAIRRVKITYLQNEADAYKQQLLTDLNPQSRALLMKQYTECVSQLRRYLDEENKQ